MLAAAVGASFERGDTVVIHTLDAAAAISPETPILPAEVRAALAKPPRPGVRSEVKAESEIEPWLALTFLAALVAVAAALLMIARKRVGPASARTEAPLTEAQRQAALAKVQAWMAADGAAAGVGEGR